ncbi:MAG: hypothetical protein GWN58_68095, partial [Anaerolineae bacterium]|nr:hypothetical protein [Anaerolineae bacterium]
MSVPNHPLTPKFDPAFTAGYSPEQIQRGLTRYAQGVQVVVDSLEAPVGQTPKEAVWTLNKTTLYRYIPTRPEEERHPVPVLLV